MVLLQKAERFRAVDEEHDRRGYENDERHDEEHAAVSIDFDADNEEVGGDRSDHEVYREKRTHPNRARDEDEDAGDKLDDAGEDPHRGGHFGAASEFLRDRIKERDGFRSGGEFEEKRLDEQK